MKYLGGCQEWMDPAARTKGVAKLQKMFLEVIPQPQRTQ